MAAELEEKVNEKNGVSTENILNGLEGDFEHLKSDAENSDEQEADLDDQNETLFSPEVYDIYHKVQLVNPSLSIACFKSPLVNGPNDETLFWHADSQVEDGVTPNIHLSSISKLKKLPNQNQNNRKNKKEEDGNDDDDISNELQNINSLPDCRFEMKSSTKISSLANRIAVSNNSHRSLAAVYLDSGNVEIFTTALRKIERQNCKIKHASVLEGKCEGFAIDWSHSSDKLAFGDNNGTLSYVSDIENNGGTSQSAIVTNEKCHKSSIEDIHWFYDSDFTFGSCSSDRTLRVWDTRCPLTDGPVLEVLKLHKSDVNVFSINPFNSNLIISGGDNGSIVLSDTRKYRMKNSSSGDYTSQGNPIIKALKWHNSPISSLEWSRQAEYEFVCACLDDSVTLWEFDSDWSSYYACPPDRKKSKNSKENGEERAAPYELYFDHRGVNGPREAHWIDGNGVIVTDMKGIDVFYPTSEY